MKAHDGGIWQPEGADPRKGHLLVCLHGRGDSAEGFEWFKQELGLPGLSVLLLNAPDPYYTGRSWYGLPPDQLPGILRSRGLLAQEFARIEGEGFSLDRTILSGFSQGCLMTLEFGARFPKRLAGYLGISGYCYDPELLLKEASAEARSGSWFITHGTQDEVLSAETTRGQIAVLKGGGMPIDYREYRKAHTIDPHRELPEIREWIRARIEGKD